MSQFYKGVSSIGTPGNVVGTPPSTDNAIARYDGITGLIIQNSTVTLDDNGSIDSFAAYAGNTKYFQIQNNDNTAGSASKMSQLVGGTSAGDVYNEFIVGAARAYSFGIDNDDSQTFKLTTAAAGNVDPSTGSTLLDITSAGQISFPSATITENGLMMVGANGLVESLGEAANGELPIGSIGADPVISTLTAGTNVTIVNGPGTVTISSTGGGVGFSWNVVTNATQALSVDNGYIGNRGTDITYTLPVTSSIGDIIRVTNIGVGLPIIAQNASQYINFTGSTTTVGVGGSLTGISQFASIYMVCIETDLGWNVLSSESSWTVV